MSKHKSKSGPTEAFVDQAYADLYFRSRAAVIAYFVLFWLLAFVTSYLKDHPFFITIMGIVISVVVGMRLTLASTYNPERYKKNPQFWKRAFFSLTIVSGLSWGVFTYFTLHFFGVTHLATFFIFVMTCGILGGSVNALAPNFSLMRSFCVAILAPPLLYGFVENFYIISFMLGLYMILILVVGKNIHTSYCSQINTNMLLAGQTKKIEETIIEITQSAKTLEEASAKLITLSTDMHSDTVDMSSKIESVATASSSMKKNITDTSGSIELSSENMTQASSSVEVMAGTMMDISDRAENAFDVSSKAAEQARKASLEVEKLNNAAQEIGNITEIITEISEQTNLLALNAAIEASRAGDAGRGFAVVANEIKELAGQTSQAISLIRQQVEGIQRSTSDSVENINKIFDVITDVNRIVNELSSEMGNQSEVSTQILHNIEKMTGSLTDISNSMEDGSIAIEEVVNNIQAVNDSKEKINVSSSGTRQSAEALKEMVDRLNKIVKNIESA